MRTGTTSHSRSTLFQVLNPNHTGRSILAMLSVELVQAKPQIVYKACAFACLPKRTSLRDWSFVWKVVLILDSNANTKIFWDDYVNSWPDTDALDLYVSLPPKLYFLLYRLNESLLNFPYRGILLPVPSQWRNYDKSKYILMSSVIQLKFALLPRKCDPTNWITGISDSEYDFKKLLVPHKK